MRNKVIFTLVTLMFCMTVLYIPVYAVEVGWDWEPEPTDDVVEPPVIVYTETFPETEFGETPEVEQSATPVSLEPRPFTPPGTGTVVDNAIGGDDKEFYTITSEDGSVFYLIIDRQRNTQNVYFLNAVTEEDLLALAEKNGRTITGVTSAPPPPDMPGETGDETPPVPAEPPEQKSSNTVMYIVVGIAFIGAGGAAYYFKIVKGRKDADEDDDDGSGTDVYVDEYGYEDDPDDGDSGSDDAEEGDDGE